MLEGWDHLCRCWRFYGLLLSVFLSHPFSSLSFVFSYFYFFSPFFQLFLSQGYAHGCIVCATLPLMAGRGSSCLMFRCPPPVHGSSFLGPVSSVDSRYILIH